MASLEQFAVGGTTYNLSVPFIVGTGTTAGTWLGQLDSLAEYYDGLLILYKPSVAGAATTTLNLNSLGAKTCYINNTTKLTTHFPANQPILLVYSTSQNSGCWMCIDDYWTNSDTYPSAKCDTAAATAAKAATCTHYTATANTFLHILIRYANTVASALTLNVNGQGAKPIYINGVASSTSNYTLPAGTYIVFYNGTNYYFRTDGKLTASITGDAATVNGLTVQTAVPANAVFTDTTYTGTGAISINASTHVISTTAEVNQNAFSNVKVGSTTVAADTKTDTLELVGSNVTLTPDATNDKVTIGITKANVDTALGESSTWSSVVSALTGDTTVTIPCTALESSSVVDVYTQNSSGTPLALNSVIVTAGISAAITFDALTENTEFKIHVINV